MAIGHVNVHKIQELFNNGFIRYSNLRCVSSGIDSGCTGVPVIDGTL
jgi:hypothetical protein